LAECQRTELKLKKALFLAGIESDRAFFRQTSNLSFLAGGIMRLETKQD
jgi:hypothetical protein